MGRRSVKKDKNIYQQAREAAGLTRERAAEALEAVSESRLEKVESGRSPVRPEEVILMAKAYRRPDLCNYYCANECPIGKKSVPQVHLEDLSRIVLETLSALNSLEKEKDRFIEITSDGKITEDELKDYERIREGIGQIRKASEALTLWEESTKEVYSAKAEE